MDAGNRPASAATDGAMMHKNPELAAAVRRTAYFLWEQDGAPQGRALDYWLRAKEMHQRHMAYDRWLAEGTPIDRSAAHWTDAAGQIGDD